MRPRTRAATFHGVRVDWRHQGAGPERRSLLEALPSASTSTAAHVTVSLELLGRGAAPGEVPDGFALAFEQGPARIFTGRGAYVVLAPGARVDVSADGRTIVSVVDGDARDAEAFGDATLLMALCLALRHHGMFYLHAGAVLLESGLRVAVLGDSGAGKSTLTVGLVTSKTHFLADDSLFFAEREGCPRLLAFPRPFRLGAAALAAHPDLQEVGELAADGKRRIPLAALPGKRMDAMDAPHVLLFPQVTRDATTSASPIEADDAFGLALRASALLIVEGVVGVPAQLALLRRLLAGTRAYAVRLGADWLADPPTTARALIARVCALRESPPPATAKVAHRGH